MSHFSVAVISKTPEDVERLLAPYQENNMGDCPKEYLVFEDEEEQHRKDYETGHREMVKTPEGKLLNPWDEVFRKKGTFGIGPETHEIPPNCQIIHIPHKEAYPTFEAFMDKYNGYSERDSEMGRYGYWYNPNTKWDYWSIGGRWSGLLKAKKGNYYNRPGFYDQAQIKDIDFSVDPEQYARAERFWEVVVEGLPLRDGEKKEDFSFFYNPSYYLEFYELKENFSTENAKLKIWALVDPNGEWYEKGSMGWWGMHDGSAETFQSFNEEWDTLLSAISPEYFLTIVDCHI